MAVKTYSVPRLAISLFSLILFISTTAHAKIIYVDDDGPADFNNIQAAIDDSNDGDTIIVNPGTYTGVDNRDIDFLGKAITVRSIEPSDPNIVASTIIDCNGTEAEPHRGFVFQNKEGRNSVLSGLTITNGQCHQGGGVCINQCSCQITKCRFISDRANGGGGLWCGGWPELTKPLITNCIFVNNEAAWGGGMEISESSRPTVMNCIFRNNHAISNGGGIYNYRALPIIIGCKFENNSAGTHSVIGGGGGLYAHTWYDPIPTLMHCLFAGNTADYGGAMVSDNDNIINCTFVDNVANDIGAVLYGYYNCVTNFKNCILWKNRDSTGMGESSQIYAGKPVLNYCCVLGLTGNLGGIGNIREDPLFVDPHNLNLYERDYHLLSVSPCIDAGDPAYIPFPGETDIDNEMRIMGPAIDMGSDEFTAPAELRMYISPQEFEYYVLEDDPEPNSQTFAISGTIPFNWEIIEICSWLEAFPRSGLCSDKIGEVRLGIDTAGLAPGRYDCELTITSDMGINIFQTITVSLYIIANDAGTLVVPLEYNTVQEAIDTASNGDVVIIAPGTYSGDGNRDIDFKGKAITVRSIEPNDPNIVAVTIINCSGTKDDPHRGFYFHSGEDGNSAINGLTITNGYVTHASGGGICCGASPQISKCILRNNYAESGGGGLLLSHSASEVRECLFIGNNADDEGGAIYVSYNSEKAIIRNCTFLDNYAGKGAYGGGGAITIDSDQNITITGCIFRGNGANGENARGGAIEISFSCPVVRNCLFSNNSADFGGGAIVNYSVNESGRIGSTILNCIFVANYARFGGAIANMSNSSPYISNCILWNNTATMHGTQMSCSSESDPCVTYNNIQYDWPGVGNIDADPCFVKPGYWDANNVWVDGDYHLMPDSPCIDNGDPNYLPELNETDLDGNPRVINGRIDMGAYEYDIVATQAEVEIDPHTLNLASKGRWITCYIWLPEEYNVADIDPKSVFLKFPNNEFESQRFWLTEDTQIAVAKFDREQVQAILTAGEVELKITGRLTDGTVFEANDVIRVLNKGVKK